MMGFVPVPVLLEEVNLGDHGACDGGGRGDGGGVGKCLRQNGVFLEFGGQFRPK